MKRSLRAMSALLSLLFVLGTFLCLPAGAEEDASAPPEITHAKGVYLYNLEHEMQDHDRPAGG